MNFQKLVKRKHWISSASNQIIRLLQNIGQVPLLLNLHQIEPGRKNPIDS